MSSRHQCNVLGNNGQLEVHRSLTRTSHMTGTAALWIITPVLNALTQPAKEGKKMQHWFVHIYGVPSNVYCPALTANCINGLPAAHD